MDGKWYFVTFQQSHHSFDSEASGTWTSSEVVFIQPGDSIAKYCRKACIAGSKFEPSGFRGMDETSTRLIEELSLLLPDGNKISGFKPKSLQNFFVDSETPYSPAARYENIYRNKHPEKGRSQQNKSAAASQGSTKTLGELADLLFTEREG